MTESAWKAAARHWWERMRQAERERDELLQKLEELRAQPSGNLGDFAALAERIAYADGKHPRDLPDFAEVRVDSSAYANVLQGFRRELAKSPSWHDAIFCELYEALVELARGDMFHWTSPAYDLIAQAAVDAILRELSSK